MAIFSKKWTFIKPAYFFCYFFNTKCKIYNPKTLWYYPEAARRVRKNAKQFRTVKSIWNLIKYASDLHYFHSVARFWAAGRQSGGNAEQITFCDRPNEGILSTSVVFTFKCIFFWFGLHSPSWKILKNVKFLRTWKIFRSQTIEITPETYKKVKRNRKIAKFSACGGPNKAKEHKNIQSKFNYQKKLHSSKTNKKTLIPVNSLSLVLCS